MIKFKVWTPGVEIRRGFFVSFVTSLCRCKFAENLDSMDKNDISDDVKLLYIEEELSQHGEWLCDVLTEAIEKRQIMQTQALFESVDYSTFKEGENPGVRVNFLTYGRFVDIAAYRKKDRHQVDTNREVWGIKHNRKHKPKQWYARNMYGGLNRLIGRVMYGLTDQEIERLKGILTNRKYGTI